MKAGRQANGLACDCSRAHVGDSDSGMRADQHHMQGSPRPKVEIAAADGAGRAAMARGLQMWCCGIHGYGFLCTGTLILGNLSVLFCFFFVFVCVGGKQLAGHGCPRAAPSVVVGWQLWENKLPLAVCFAVQDPHQQTPGGPVSGVSPRRTASLPKARAFARLHARAHSPLEFGGPSRSITTHHPPPFARPATTTRTVAAHSTLCQLAIQSTQYTPSLPQSMQG